MAVITSNIAQPPLGGIVNFFTQGDPILKIDDRIIFLGYGIYQIVGVGAQTPLEGEYDGQRLSGTSDSIIPAGSTILTQSESLQHTTKNYTATTYFSFSEPSYQTMLLAVGNLTLAAQHHAPGRSIAIRLINVTSTPKTLSFPGSWTFLGAKPSTLAGNKTGVLSLTCFSGSIGDNVFASDADVIAVWATS